MKKIKYIQIKTSTLYNLKVLNDYIIVDTYIVYLSQYKQPKDHSLTNFKFYFFVDFLKCKSFQYLL